MNNPYKATFSPAIVSKIDKLKFIERVNYHHHVDVLEVSRIRYICYARQLSMYVLFKHAGIGYTEIGRIFGKRHSTVIHAVKLIDNLKDVDKNVTQHIQDFEDIYFNKI